MRASLLSPLFFILLFSIQQSAFSQKLPFKIGKVTEEELLLDSCEFYPEANSMVLAEYGDLKFGYHDDKGWQYHMEVGVRKKIFKITDADEGNIKIRVYEPEKGSSEEEISGLKAFSYNLVDGKVEKDKLKNNEFFKKRINDYWVEISFAIPNIKDGSVIEYSYTLTSGHLMNLSTWYFQGSIPTAHSEFRYTIPEYFNYQASQLGNIFMGDTDTRKVRERFTYKWSSSGAMGQTRSGTGTLESNSTYNQIVLKNIMPLKDEPYMNNERDVPSRMEFQLISTKFPNSTMEVVAGNYEKFNKELCESTYFGDKLKKGGFIKDYLETVASKSDSEKAIGIYNHVKNEIAWSGDYGFTSDDAGRSAYKEHEGSVSDINLSLIAAFREAGFEAYPIVLSTRGHGVVHPIYPSYEDFNYVIGLVMVGENGYFCDASSNLPLGQLPVRCRNGNGWLVNEPNGKWINLKQNASYSKTTMLKTSIDDTQLNTHVSARSDGYSAYYVIKEIQEETEEGYSKSLASSFDDSEIANLTVSELDYSQPVSVEYDVIKERAGDIIYLQPILTGSVNENPFRREERFSTIDFPYSQSYRVIASIVVPEGYTAELPEPALIKLPNNEGQFVYNLNQNGNVINVMSNISIAQTDFTTKDYKALKQFFQLIEDKHNELIVLKK